MAKKPLRDITPKGDKKLLDDKLKGVNKSENKPMDLDDFLMDPENMKGTKDFVKKHEVQQHDDRVGNKEAPYKSSKGQAKYERADAKMYEAADCTCDDDKDSCAVHGKGHKKLLLGGKKNMKEHAELSGLEAQVGAVPEGMARNAENTWKNAEQYFDRPPTQLTGQGKPFLAKMGDSLKEAIREIQNEAVANLHEKLTDDAKGKIRTALTPKMKETSKPAKALITIAKMNKDNIKEEQSKAVVKAKGENKLNDIKGKKKSQDLYDKLTRMKNRGVHKEEVEELDEKNWIAGAIKHPGALHKELGVPEGEKIPAAKLNAAAKEGGKIGQRARLAKTLGKMHEEDEVMEDAPPSKNSEEWIKKNKSRFTKEYGKKKGESILYGKAWNDYKEKH